MRGIRAVDKALGVFTKIKDKLQGAVNRCLDEINDKEEHIGDLRHEIGLLRDACEKAGRVLDALNNIIGV